MTAQTMLKPSADRIERPRLIVAERAFHPEAVMVERSTYQTRRLDPVSAVAAVMVAAAAFTSFQYLGTMSAHKHEHRLRVINVLDLPKPPPPEVPPAQKVDPTLHIQPPIVAPPPIVATPTPPPTVAVAPTPAPPAPAPVAAKVSETAPAPPSVAPADVGDLSSKMISATPPTYPEESRRLHEQGTVVLTVLLGADGRVAQMSVSKSSGFFRLDRAASSAVRRWRWSPTIRNGEAVLVQGNVVIPFVLRG